MTTCDLQWASQENGSGLVRRSLEPVGSDTISRQIVSALSYNVGHPAGVRRLFDMSKTYTSSVRGSV